MTIAAFYPSQRTLSVLPGLIFALAMGLAVLFPFLPLFAIRGCVGTLLAALIFHGLLAAGFPLFHAMAITALSFSQAGIFQSATGKAGGIWLALSVYCVAYAAAAFVQHRDARHVIVLGAALSLAQVVDPVGAVLAVFLLPVCVGLPRAGEAANKVGLLALLLFMPVATAATLAYARGVLGFDPMHFARAGRAHAERVPLYILLVAGFAGAPVLWLTTLVRSVRRPAGLIAVYTGLSVLVAVTFAFLLGTERDMASVLAANGAISAAALSNWPRAYRHAYLALAATALAATVSWLLIGISSAAV